MQNFGKFGESASIYRGLYGFFPIAPGFSASSMQLDFVAQIYVAIYFFTAPGFMWLLSNNSTASYIQLDSVIQIYVTTFIRLLILFGFFPIAPGFVWFLTIGFKFSDFLYFKQNFNAKFW